jgi:hypothetical protein
VSDGAGRDARGRPAARPQHEIDAQIMREKSARLRELRLARDAALSGGTPAPKAPRKATGKAPRKEPGNERKAERSVSLSQWRSVQEREGRRN